MAETWWLRHSEESVPPPRLNRSQSLLRHLCWKRSNILLLFTLLSLLALPTQGLGGLGGLGASLSFLICGIGLLPLAMLLSELVENLAERLGDRLGGLVSVSLGNLVELIVGFSALRSGLYNLVVVSIGGSVLTNCLLVLGCSILIGTLRRKDSQIHPEATELQTQLLLISILVLFIPSLFANKMGFDLAAGGTRPDALSSYSFWVAALVLGCYLLSFFYQMGTHRELFIARHACESNPDQPPHGHGQAPLALLGGLLLGISVMLALVSDRLVDSLEVLVKGAHVSPLFVGLFLLPLFSSLPEALVSIQAARRQNMDLAMSGTIESSVQLLLFVLPVLVLVGVPFGRHLNLSFPHQPLAALAGTVLLLQGITLNRRLIWYEGLQLLLLYFVLALAALLLG